MRPRFRDAAKNDAARGCVRDWFGLFVGFNPPHQKAHCSQGDRAFASATAELAEAATWYTPPAMISGSRARTAVIAVVVLVAATVLGYCGFREYGERGLHAAVVALVADTTARLRDALDGAAGARAADPTEVARRLDEQAGEVDQRLAALHRLRASPDRALFDAADLYMVTARELLRRTASTHRDREAFVSSTRALRNLAQTADRRSGAWIGQAIAAKERAERDYSDYRRAVDATVSLLESLGDPRERLARRVDPAILIEEGLRAQAAERAREAGKRAAEELDHARRLTTRP